MQTALQKQFPLVNIKLEILLLFQASKASIENIDVSIIMMSYVNENFFATMYVFNEIKCQRKNLFSYLKNQTGKLQFLYVLKEKSALHSQNFVLASVRILFT